MRYLTFALTKGRLANKTLEMLEMLGITCEEMKDKSSRKLIFVNEELKLKFFLAKGPDVPTYVRVWGGRYRCGRQGYDRGGRTQGARGTGSGIRQVQNVRMRA